MRSMLAKTPSLMGEVMERPPAKEGLARTLSAGDLSREKPFARLLMADGPVATLPTVPTILTFCSCDLCDVWAREQGACD